MGYKVVSQNNNIPYTITKSKTYGRCGQKGQTYDPHGLELSQLNEMNLDS